MRKIALLVPCLMSLIVGLVSLGCGSTPEGPPHPHAGKIEYSKIQLRLDDIRVYKNASDLLAVDIDFYNRRENGSPYRYQVQWYDASGMVLSSADQGWRNTTINHGYHTMNLVAKNTRAVDFKMKIVKDK